jgi:hypothetical protein
MPEPDLKRLAVLLDMAITSDQPGEAESAMRAVVKLLRKTGLRGSDFVAAMGERDRALDALAQYEVRLTALEAENGRLQARANANGADSTLGQALWVTAGMPATVESGHAVWVLDLDAQGSVNLTEKETAFLGSCSRRSRLTQPQKEWLQDIVRHASARARQTPPP